MKGNYVNRQNDQFRDCWNDPNENWCGREPSACGEQGLRASAGQSAGLSDRLHVEVRSLAGPLRSQGSHSVRRGMGRTDKFWSSTVTDWIRTRRVGDALDHPSEGVWSDTDGLGGQERAELEVQCGKSVACRWCL